MDGIVYLHGKVTPDYKKAEDAGFVLSSSQFGQRIFQKVGLLPSFEKSLTGTSLSSSATRRTILLFIIC